MPTIEQIRAARALLDWSQSDLADHAGLSQTGIARIENGTNKPNTQTIDKIMAAFESADIEFLGFTGVRRKTGEIRTLRGAEGFKKFVQDVLRTAEKGVGDFYVSNVNENLFVKWLGDYKDFYLTNMQNLKKEGRFDFKILVAEGDHNHVAGYAEYRWLRSENMGSAPFYMYGDKLAIISFDEDSVEINIIINKAIADAQRKQFDLVWDSAEKF